MLSLTVGSPHCMGLFDFNGENCEIFVNITSIIENRHRIKKPSHLEVIVLSDEKRTGLSILTHIWLYQKVRLAHVHYTQRVSYFFKMFRKLTWRNI